MLPDVSPSPVGDVPAAVVSIDAGPLTVAVGGRPTFGQIGSFLLRRVLLGLLTLVLVSIVVFAATQVLPGNAAYAVLGHTASPSRVHLMERQLHLNESVWHQYGRWFSGLVRGHLGNSLVNGESVWSQLSPRLSNSAFLVLLSSLIGTMLGVSLGVLAALRRNGVLDQILSVATLTVLSMPEFIVAILVVILFATKVSHLLPAVSIFPPGTNAWDRPRYCILPVLTMVLVVIPYISRTVRAAVSESLESEYVEYAYLKGISRRRILFRHVLPNVTARILQVIGLILLYLAGGIVVVEYVYAFPGIGQGLVNAVSDRDIPTIQSTVLILAAFYVVVNIIVDVISLRATPGRR